MKFYTDIRQIGDTLFYSYIENGERTRSKFKFSPKIYTKSQLDATHCTIYKEPLVEHSFVTIKECKSFIERHKDIENMKLYGNGNYSYQFLAEEYKEEVKYNINDIDMCFIDIETEVGDCFPHPDTAKEKITLITLCSSKNGIITFGYKPYTGDESINYVECDGEIVLLRKFVQYWSSHYPDIVSGWNTESFDIPYIYNRISEILGVEYAKRLSPFGVVSAREIRTKKKDKSVKIVNTYDIYGVQHLDYLNLYKKFTFITRENYKLDTIGYYELKQNKLKNPYKTFKEFYSGEYDIEKIRPDHQEIDELGLRRTLIKKELLLRGLIHNE